MTTKTMRRDEQNPPRLEDVQIPVRMKLSALWATVMFLYVYVDILAFYKPGTIEDILVGRVWEFDISQAWALGALALMTIPSLMVFLSLALPAHLARWANVVVATLLVLVSIGNAASETWSFYWFGSAVEVALLLVIVWYAWTWPRLLDRVAGHKSSEGAVTSMQSSVQGAVDGDARSDRRVQGQETPAGDRMSRRSADLDDELSEGRDRPPHRPDQFPTAPSELRPPVPRAGSNETDLLQVRRMANLGMVSHRPPSPLTTGPRCPPAPLGGRTASRWV